MKIGFTGTRQGMTEEQASTFEDLTDKLYRQDKTVREFHHGDCIGADEDAHDILRSFPGLYLHSHPCTLFRQRANTENDVEYDALAPLDRNKVIVESVDIMIACPSGTDELFRGSGTWATIRHARRTKKKLFVIWPNGTVLKEN
jgi:hypothetical protein